MGLLGTADAADRDSGLETGVGNGECRHGIKMEIYEPESVQYRMIDVKM